MESRATWSQAAKISELFNFKGESFWKDPCFICFVRSPPTPQPGSILFWASHQDTHWLVEWPESFLVVVNNVGIMATGHWSIGTLPKAHWSHLYCVSVVTGVHVCVTLSALHTHRKGALFCVCLHNPKEKCTLYTFLPPAVFAFLCQHPHVNLKIITFN